MDKGKVISIINALNGHSILDFIKILLTDTAYNNDPTRYFIFKEAPDLISVLLKHGSEQQAIKTVVSEFYTGCLTSEITRMAAKNTGWHFTAKNATSEQIEKFSVKEMSEQLEEEAPLLWALLGELLSSDKKREARRVHYKMTKNLPQKVTESDKEDQIMWTDEEEYWANDAEGGIMEENLDIGDSGEERVSKRQQCAMMKTDILSRVKRVTIASILLQSTNQMCNAMQSVIGIFCHSTGASEIVIEMLAHAGLSVSITPIQRMVTSLSAKAHICIRNLAQTKLAAFAYDNFDMEFHSALPTIDKPEEGLKHATSALIFPLSHGVKADDLRCSQKLWSTDPLNPHIPDTDKRSKRSWTDCVPDKPSNLKHEINAWHFRNALVTYCEPFTKYKAQLGSPPVINKIPQEKTSFIPFRAMDINQSTTDGQSKILEAIIENSGLGDPTDAAHDGVPLPEDINEYVLLVHGDLRTGELIDGARRSRSIETKPVRRLQFVVFIMGLFHYLMHCGEGLWKMFIEPKSVRSGENSFYQQMCKIRPHDSGRIMNKFSFRYMHDLAHQIRNARMLDCWRVAVQKLDSAYINLEKYAASEPTWESIVKMSHTLASTYVDNVTNQDKEFQNNSLILARLLNYIEVAHAMKHGDIGRVEATFLPWAFIFKSIGKHKYATHLIRMMNDMKYVYDEKLQHAIRMHWLININGKPDGFRAVDWVVELLNLFTKVTYGSSGSARTFDWIQKQSAIIGILREVHTIIQNNFHLLHRSKRHATSDLSKTLKVLTGLLEEHGAYEIIQGRPSSYLMKDHYCYGMHILGTEKGQIQDECNAEIESAREELELEDIVDL